MQDSQTPYQGIWLALVTPFRNDEIDRPALKRLMAHYRDSGISGLVVCGSTGEAAALDESEQLAVLDTVLEEAGGLPVIMGLAGNNQRRVLARLDAYNSRPLAGVLVPAPYYIRPSQAGLQGYFQTIADASAAPVVLYDIPYRTGVALTADTLLRLAEHGNIQAIKDCGGNAQTTRALIEDGRLAVLAGEDHQIFATLCLGGQGAISAAAHIRPDLYVALHRTVAEHRLDTARRLATALAPMIQLLFAEPNPGPIKALLARQGLLIDELRAPMLPASQDLAVKLAAAHDVLNSIATTDLGVVI
ncbi:MAG TPA: 4-hydroxy-tetrahydrodipicolinate synthase [Bordetella sp.]|uniref:4-hydroxy-tetrahydrodipicolinate synthase n=1 Tax=Bordetella sp. TaxID=28081 RepID=UPI002ED6BE1D